MVVDYYLMSRPKESYFLVTSDEDGIKIREVDEAILAEHLCTQPGCHGGVPSQYKGSFEGAAANKALVIKGRIVTPRPRGRRFVSC